MNQQAPVGAMTAEERAKDILTRCWSEKRDPSPSFAGLDVEIARAVHEAEQAMKERAAKVCDEAEQRNLRGDGEGTAPEHLAAAIRALK